MTGNNCENCHEFTPHYDMVNYGSVDEGYRQLCTTCFNKEVAAMGNLTDFEHVRFEPVVMTDVAGEDHEFHFRTRLMGTMVILESFELIDELPQGYRFQMIGEPEEDLLALLGKLIERMRRSLAVKHLEESELGPSLTNNMIVRGRVEWDEANDGHAPLLIIDGKEVSWEEMGRILMGVQGWQFKLQIYDTNEEI